jgi:hypothetical protein
MQAGILIGILTSGYMLDIVFIAKGLDRCTVPIKLRGGLAEAADLLSPPRRLQLGG